jgi:hypothetical protein
MKETRVIWLSQDVLDTIASDAEDRLENLEKELESDSDIESMLGCYHESGEVEYEITNLEVDQDGCGNMEVSYTAYKYSGCKDINLDEEGDMVISIVIDMETGDTKLEGEDVPTRDPDEY